MFAVLLDRVAVTSGLLRLGNLDIVSIADIPQHFPFPEPPAVVGVSVIVEPHFVKCLILSVENFKPSGEMPDRDAGVVWLHRGASRH